MIRLLALVATGTRSMLDVPFGSDRVGELTYAGRLAEALTSGMLLLALRGDTRHEIASWSTEQTARDAHIVDCIRRFDRGWVLAKHLCEFSILAHTIRALLGSEEVCG